MNVKPSFKSFKYLMGELKGFRTLAEQIKDLDDHAPPKDHDPEDFGYAFERREASDEEDEDEAKAILGREHYESVG